MIQILDTRYWNGVIPPGYAYIKGYIAKATDGDYFTSPEFAMQYRAAEQLFGRARSAWSFFKGVSDPKAAAKRYHDLMVAAGGYGGIPPVLDIEDKYAPKGKPTVDKAWAQLQEMEQLAGREVMVYSAGWYWDSWCAPFIPLTHPIYTRDLWEADPGPDTPIKGWPNGGIMTQTILDWRAPGFIDTAGNPGLIDLSDVPEATFNAWVGPTTPPPDTVTLTISRAIADELHRALHA
jgi:hypothetical protein